MAVSVERPAISHESWLQFKGKVLGQRPQLGSADPESVEFGVFQNTLNFLQRFDSTKKTKALNSSCHSLAERLAQNPEVIPPVLMYIAEAMDEFPNSNLARLPDVLFPQLEREIRLTRDLSKWQPDLIESVVSESLNSSGFYNYALELVKRTLFEQTPVAYLDQAVQRAVDIHYSASWAMVMTEDPRVREELLAIICLEKDWHTADGASARSIQWTPFLSDEATHGKFNAITIAANYFGFFSNPDNSSKTRLDNPRTRSRHQRMIDTSNISVDVQQKIELIQNNLFAQSPDRFHRVHQALADNQQKSVSVDRESDDFEEELRRLGKLAQMGISENELTRIAEASQDPLVLHLYKFVRPHVARAFSDYQLGKLAELGYDRLTGHGLEIDPEFQLQVLTKAHLSPEQKRDLVLEIYRTVQTGRSHTARSLMVDPEKLLQFRRIAVGYSCYYDEAEQIVISLFREPKEPLGKLASMLEYSKPDFGLEQTIKAAEDIKRKRQAIKSGVRRLVDGRGYISVEPRPGLRNLGYKHFIFKREERSDTIQAEIELGGQSFQFMIDNRTFQVIPGGDLQKFATIRDRVWFEHLCLSHLQRVMCFNDNDQKLADELVGGREQATRYKKQRPGRKDFLRHLPGLDEIRKGLRRYHQATRGPQYKIVSPVTPTTEAKKRYAASEYPAVTGCETLDQLNDQRAQEDNGGTLETGFWTYAQPVKELHRNYDSKDPIRVALNQDSTAEELFGLEKPSDEEVARVVDEIMSEFI